MHPGAAAPPGEVEVQLSAYLRRLTRRWYVVLAAMTVAFLLALMSNLGNTRTGQARASVYLGQPGGLGEAAPNPRGNPTTASAFVGSDRALAPAARASGIPLASLRASVAIHPLLAGGTTTSRLLAGPPIVQITVRGPFGARRRPGPPTPWHAS